MEDFEPTKDNKKITAKPKPAFLIDMNHSVKRTISVSFSNNLFLASPREIAVHKWVGGGGVREGGLSVKS
jgi:hypothetical protein